MRLDQWKAVQKELDFHNKQFEKDGRNHRMIFMDGKFQLVDMIKNKFEKESFSPVLRIYRPEQ